MVGDNFTKQLAREPHDTEPQCKFHPSPLSGALRQGELLTDLQERYVETLNDNGSETPEFGVVLTKHPYSIVLSQDCDLDQDFRTRVDASGVELKPTVDDQQKTLVKNKLRQIPYVLLCQAESADKFIERSDVDRNVLKRITTERTDDRGNKRRFATNKEERFYFIESVPQDCDRKGEGLPELVLDFKKVIAVPTIELYRTLNRPDAATKRRCFLCPPFAQNLSQRFTSYLGRVGLPSDFMSS